MGLRPPIGRVGGKRYLKKMICELIPSHITYCEPFIGGGAVFYEKPISAIEIINDLEEGIFNVHHGLKYHGREIHELIPREMDKQGFNDFKNSKPEGDVDRAIRDIVLSKYSYRTDRTSYLKPIPGHNGKISTDYRVYPDRLRNTIVRNEDALKIIPEYDGENTFFYLDPPYENSKATALYENSDFNLKALVDILRGLKGKFLLSMNDSPYVRELFTGFHIMEVETRYSIACMKQPRSSVNELFIANYDLK
jgi:DNA adenine methylase